MTARGYLTALSALMLGAAVTACATVPTSGNISVSTNGSGGAGQNGVQIEPVPPGRAWSPEQIVNGFLAASASPKYSAAGAGPNYAVAREYLTKAYSKQWRPGWAATIIDSPEVHPAKFSRLKPIQQTGQQNASVVVRGQHLATLQATGKYQPGSIVVGSASTQFLFALGQVAGQWRIDGVQVNGVSAPPTLLLLRQSDFERDYQPRNLYFYGPGKNANALVPDPVYIPQQAGSRGIVQGLVGALLKPPPGRRNWLYKAVTTAFPPGTKVLGSPQVSGQLAIVRLGGAAAKATLAQRWRMEAQLYWTLTKSPYSVQTANPITSVALNLNGEKVPPLPTYSRYLPSSAGAQLYFQDPVGQAGPVVVMRSSNPQPVTVPLPRALAGATFGLMAVSTAPVGSAVVAGCSGKTLYLLPQSHSGVVITRRLPSACTALSWDVHGNLWVATGSQISKIPSAGSRPPAQPTLLPVTVLKYPHGKFVALRVAPDGVRVALIVQVGSATKIEVAAISKVANIIYLAQKGQMLPVGPDIPHPIALTWYDPNHLLVLGRQGPSRNVLYQVPLDGATSTEVPTPLGSVKSVAAGLKGQQQRVVVAIAPTSTLAGQIEMSTTGLTNPDWLVQAKGITPVFPG